MIHVFSDDYGVQVWLDTEDGERDGLCIGSAKTLSLALLEARERLLIDKMYIDLRLENERKVMLKVTLAK